MNKLIHNATTTTTWLKKSGSPQGLWGQKILQTLWQKQFMWAVLTANSTILLLIHSIIVVAAPQSNCEIRDISTSGISSTHQENKKDSSCISTIDSPVYPEKALIFSEYRITDSQDTKSQQFITSIDFQNQLVRQPNLPAIVNWSTPASNSLEQSNLLNLSSANNLTLEPSIEFLDRQQQTNFEPSVFTSYALQQKLNEEGYELNLLSSTSHRIQIAQGAQPLPAPADGELGELRLRELEEQSQSDTDELGRLRIREIIRRSPQMDSELGILQIRELEQQPKLPDVVPPAPSPRFGSLFAQIGYFQANNIFSGVDPIQGGLFSSGVTLITTPKLGENTDLIAAIDGSLIRYIEQPESNYNQFRIRAGIRQKLSPQMFGEIGLINQQLFRSESGNRFLNENALRFVLRRRDRLTNNLRLDSLYELRLTDADPETRSRIINSLLVSLSYNLQNNFLVGLDYQFAISDFTQRDREDQFHRLLGRLTYAASRSSQFNLQAGVTLGGSSAPNVNFDNLFLSVTYTVELGKF
ncbi:hypothetical protein [Gloeocapsopsis dulcis]|uniref:Uncharacterized protein n=1 Tax=Gloeocapsopsis dulcis AAB1 = 1H9 TaxID=1433147 RepID=A0A6N8FYJ7_9CHRO|nr:hypothetical protein [Gloeocapsopsis dulcis]MUL36986.1 hypothetical protein [Gloeocapsopsis dulcis AAB1 = 1H9]WNN87839.1 hypothetical protein P0S91_16160 [Gloeocapsopsis dulcis]